MSQSVSHSVSSTKGTLNEVPDFLTIRKEKLLMLKYSPAPSPSKNHSPLAAELHRLHVR